MRALSINERMFRRIVNYLEGKHICQININTFHFKDIVKNSHYSAFVWTFLKKYGYRTTIKQHYDNIKNNTRMAVFMMENYY
jgi:hypothetical protein